MSDFEYKVLLATSGLVTLYQGDEVMWTSAGDTEFVREFGGEKVDGTELGDVTEWLTENEYIPPDVEVAYEDEGEESGWFEAAAENDDGDDDDDDSEEAGELAEFEGE